MKLIKLWIADHDRSYTWRKKIGYFYIERNFKDTNSLAFKIYNNRRRNEVKSKNQPIVIYWREAVTINDRSMKIGIHFYFYLCFHFAFISLSTFLNTKIFDFYFLRYFWPFKPFIFFFLSFASNSSIYFCIYVFRCHFFYLLSIFHMSITEHFHLLHTLDYIFTRNIFQYYVYMSKSCFFCFISFL